MSNNKELNFIITINYAKGKVLSTSLDPASKAGCRCNFEAAAKDRALEECLETWLSAYCRKEWPPIDTIPFAWEYLPAFTQAALKIVSAITPGEVLTYQEVAIALGRPTAARAVGGACGRNLFPLLIPCHRVLDTNRKMRGYSAGNGVVLKEALLTHEGVL
jgi:methylated-DNA-[protein]-cysteine S-methyltransferase